MNELELRKHAVCSACRRKILHTGVPLFWTAKVERFGIDMREAARADVGAAFIGHYGIARAMGAVGGDIATPVMDAVTITICETCASSPDALPIAAMVEHAQQ